MKELRGQMKVLNAWTKRLSLKCLKLSLLLLLSFFLMQCSKPKFNLSLVEAPEGLPHQVAHSSDKKIFKLRKVLGGYGIKVLKNGQDYLIRIPSRLLFNRQSPQLKMSAYEPLDRVICFLKEFRTVSIQVTAYGIKYVSLQREDALTLARARAVADHLWSQCVDARFIFVDGQGSRKPITANSCGGDFSANSRIEITFKDVIL